VYVPRAVTRAEDGRLLLVHQPGQHGSDLAPNVADLNTAVWAIDRDGIGVVWIVLLPSNSACSLVISFLDNAEHPRMSAVQRPQSTLMASSSESATARGERVQTVWFGDNPRDPRDTNNNAINDAGTDLLIIIIIII